MRVFRVGWVVVVVCVVLAFAAGPAGAKVFGPSGQIAFARFDPILQDDVSYTVNPDGSNLQQLLPGFTSGLPHWSPDGSEVAVVSLLGTACAPTCTGNTVIINAQTRAYRVLASQGFPAVSTFCSIWAPDAGHFACDGENDSDPSVNGVYTIRSSDGGGLTRLTNAGAGNDIPIDYSPDGKQIVFGRTGPFHTCDVNSALYVVNVDGSGLRRITPPGFCDDDGSWSPDGTKIAFATNSFAVGQRRRLGKIYVVHPDGTGLAQIPIPIGSLSGLGDVSWSPDGTKISFLLFTARGPGTGQEGIYTANANGTDVQQVTSSPPSSFDRSTDWGPHPTTP